MNYSYREVRITDGALNNNYFSVGRIVDFFPNDVLGGANRDKSAERQIMIFWGAGRPVKSDIAGDKNVFRERSWVGDFYDAHKIQRGDRVIVEKISEYRYHIYPKRDD